MGGCVLTDTLNSFFFFVSQETIFSLVDILSAMKINQLQLYMQNTFAFPGHETVWRSTTPYSARYVSGGDLSVLFTPNTFKFVGQVAGTKFGPYD